MKRIIIFALIVITPFWFLATTATDSQAGFGAGIHYLKTIDDMSETSGFDSSSLGFLGVYSFGSGLINFELDFEYVPNYALDKDLLQPSAYVFVGGFIYGGLGVGVSHFNGKWAEDPFFDLRAGLKIAVFDLFASYRMQEFNELSGLNTDDFNSVTFGAIFKF